MAATFEHLVKMALEEDIGQEDITTTRTVPADGRCRGRLVAKENGVLSGIEVFRLVFDAMNADASDWDSLSDADRFSRGDDIATFSGNTRGVLTGERTAMNFVQHLSGVATLTAKYVAAVEGLNVVICDTRKTTPLLRRLEKRAVVHGGGKNHRHTLFNGIVIKENHIAAAGGIGAAVRSAREIAPAVPVEVEVETLEELEQAFEAGADMALLDEFTLVQLREAVRRNRERPRPLQLEASGGIDFQNLREIAETGVDFISIGAITKHVKAVDLSMRMELVF